MLTGHGATSRSSTRTPHPPRSTAFSLWSTGSRPGTTSSCCCRVVALRVTSHVLTPQTIRVRGDLSGGPAFCGPPSGGYTHDMELEVRDLIPVSLDPNPVIEAYKKDVDRRCSGRT